MQYDKHLGRISHQLTLSSDEVLQAIVTWIRVVRPGLYIPDNPHMEIHDSTGEIAITWTTSGEDL